MTRSLSVAVAVLACCVAPFAALASPTATAGRAPVTVRLFVDLECPFSRQAWPVYREAVKGQAGATLVVHHLPLSRHQHARGAALAAVGARQQGKELEFIDHLLRDPVPDAAALTRAAVAAQLDGARLSAFVASAEAQAVVDRERQAGLAFGIQATPSALVNGRGIAGVPPEEALGRALQVATQLARRLHAEAGASADVERLGLLHHAPEFAAVFDALRGGRAPGAVGEAPVTAVGRLGARYRVTLPATQLASGRGDALVTAVYFLEPSSAWQLGQLRDLLALQARTPDLRVVAQLLPRPDAQGRLAPGARSGLDVALLLAAAAGQPEPGPARLLQLAAQRPGLGAADVEALAAQAGLDPEALRKAADAPATTAQVQAGLELARRIDAWPGTLYLNGKRWLGHLGDRGLDVALHEVLAEARQAAAAGGAPGLYERLVAPGRWRSDAELDLQQPEVLGDVAPLPELGTAGQPVHLFVDFASPHSRAAFYMLKRLVTSADLPVRLRLVSIAASAEPGVTPSGASFIVAHRMGKGVEFAQALFDARNPNEWKTIFALVKKHKLPLGEFQKQIDADATRAVARAAEHMRTRLDMADEPVLYIGDRLYSGPLDEARIERAIRFVATP